MRALHQVSAYAAESVLTLRQRGCEEKSNEITAIAELLPALALEGVVVTVGEDASPIRLRNAAHNFSFLRRLALNLFRADKSRSISLPRKLKTAAYNPTHLVTALHLREI